MTAQDITATAGNPVLQRDFSAGSSTDGQWNNVTSTLSSQAIGLELPNVTLNNLQINYTAGAAVARIISGKTLRVKGHILANKVGYACVSSSMLSRPVKLMSDDLLQVYPVAVNATANDSEIIGLVHTTGGTLPFKATTTSDNTAMVVTELNTGQGIGDVFFQSIVTGFEFQAEDGALLNRMTILDSQGGTVSSYYGTVRGPVLGSLSNLYNIKVSGLRIPVFKGWNMFVYATTA
jgi:hypothetical protein